MLKYSFFLLLLTAATSFGQCKTFIIGVKGDTLNCTDNAGLKQGKWAINTPDLRGEKGFEEEGIFADNKREGTWRRYSLQGDLLALENYKYGFKNGKSEYYSPFGEMIREESWRAVNPDYPYDTVDVYDLQDQNKITQRIVKVEGSSYRHGTWTYYDPQTGTISKTENYVLDKLQTPFNKGLAAQTLTGKDSANAKKIPKPAEVQAYEKKNSNKKKIKVRDGATGY